MASLEAIRLFVQTVDAGSFTAVARRLGVTPSAVSRRVAGLERDLGVLLLARSTRALRLTTDGAAFHARCSRVLDELEDAQNALARAKRTPSGLLRIDVPISLGRTVIVPAIPELLDRHPDVRIDMTMRDQRIDPVAEGVDVLVRIGELTDSDLVARRLGEARMVLCASPAYLRKHGTPRTPDELARHQRIGYFRDGRPDPFVILTEQGRISVDPPTRFNTNDADAMATVARAGHGIVKLFDFAIRKEIDAGELVALDDLVGPSWPIHALYPRNGHLIAKVSAFLDFASELFARPPGTPRTTGPRTRASRSAATGTTRGAPTRRKGSRRREKRAPDASTTRSRS